MLMPPVRCTAASRARADVRLWTLGLRGGNLFAVRIKREQREALLVRVSVLPTQRLGKSEVYIISLLRSDCINEH